MNSPFEFKKKPPINFSMRVIATDLPVDHDNFKIKMAINFVPDFLPTTEYTDPNFNGNRVKEILQFISEDVITKVIEFIYYDRSNQYDTNNQGAKYDEAIKIYDERKMMLSKKGIATDEQKSKVKDHREEEIQAMVKAFMTKKGRTPSVKERNVSNILFEHLSPGKLTVSVNSVVNGEKKLPR